VAPFQPVRTHVRTKLAHALSVAVMYTAVAATLLTLSGPPAEAAEQPAGTLAAAAAPVVPPLEGATEGVTPVAPDPALPPPPGTDPVPGPDQGGTEEPGEGAEVPVPPPGTDPGTVPDDGAEPEPVPPPGTDPGQPDQGGSGDDGDDDEPGKQGPSAVPSLPLPVVVPPVAQVPDITGPVRNRSLGDRIRAERSADAESGTGDSAEPGDTGSVAAATGAATVGTVAGATAAPGGTGGADAEENNGRSGSGGEADEEGSPVTRTVTRTVKDIVEVVPDSAKIALALLVALAVVLGAGYLFSTARARRLARQRRELLQEVGLLQGALLPAVPATFGSLRTSVAYRPAEGPGAGGDFYDVLPLTGGRVGFILGDVSGHGRAALARTAFMRYTLRAYLEAGLEPRMALQVAGRVIDDNLGGDFATVLIAVHDPNTSSLTYASAGHPSPIVVGGEPHTPVTIASSPPIGVGVRTGLRQTTVPLEPGSVACLFTDGLIEARTQEGILGRERLEEIIAGLGRDADAEELLARIAAEARVVSDDMATCLITPTTGVTAGGFRTEQLELSAADLEGTLATTFLEACEIPAEDAERALREARGSARHFGGVVIHVVLGNRRHVEVLPRNVESIEAASRRTAASR